MQLLSFELIDGIVKLCTCEVLMVATEVYIYNPKCINRFYCDINKLSTEWGPGPVSASSIHFNVNKMTGICSLTDCICYNTPIVSNHVMLLGMS